MRVDVPLRLWGEERGSQMCWQAAKPDADARPAPLPPARWGVRAQTPPARNFYASTSVMRTLSGNLYASGSAFTQSISTTLIYGGFATMSGTGATVTSSECWLLSLAMFVRHMTPRVHRFRLASHVRRHFQQLLNAPVGVGDVRHVQDPQQHVTFVPGDLRLDQALQQQRHQLVLEQQRKQREQRKQRWLRQPHRTPASSA